MAPEVLEGGFQVLLEVARVDVWRALLAEAVARGDLAGFLRVARASAGVR